MLFLLKNVLSSISSYFIFRANKSVAIGTPVNHNGFIGKIKSIDMFAIKIESYDGDIKRVKIDDFWKKVLGSVMGKKKE